MQWQQRREEEEEERGKAYLVWKELAAWLVAHGVTEGGEIGGWCWLQLEEEEAEACKEEGKLVVGAVGIIIHPYL
jgi:hypothetical protein